MLKRLLSCKKGEGYIEMCIGVIAFVMVLVIAINIFSFITLKVEIDQIAEYLIEVATYTGEFGDVSKETYIKGLGVFKIPITISVRRSGLSERYWK